jgi:Arc/MetJ-type ribon-helix-helix transcriptional regulator
MQTQKEITTIPISTRVTRPMYEAMIRLLRCNAHINVSDYVRDLIREDLEKKGALPEGTKESKQ